jgi:hypothetical protein
VAQKKIKKDEIENVPLRMFVRKKNNRSGTISVVIVSKQAGVYREVRTVGTSSDASKVSELVVQGKEWIHRQNFMPDIFDKYEREKAEREKIEYVFNNIENILLNGVQQILNRVYCLIGFDSVEDRVLKELVVARICQPRSKVATVDYLKSHFDEDIDLNKIYRYLDVLQSTHQQIVQQISVEHTRKILGGKIGLVFYDVTYSEFFIIRNLFIIALKYRLL